MDSKGASGRIIERWDASEPLGQGSCGGKQGPVEFYPWQATRNPVLTASRHVRCWAISWGWMAKKLVIRSDCLSLTLLGAQEGSGAGEEEKRLYSLSTPLKREEKRRCPVPQPEFWVRSSMQVFLGKTGTLDGSARGSGARAKGHEPGTPDRDPRNCCRKEPRKDRKPSPASSQVWAQGNLLTLWLLPPGFQLF